MEMYLLSEVAGEEKLEALKAISGHLDVIARMLSGVTEPAERAKFVEELQQRAGNELDVMGDGVTD